MDTVIEVISQDIWPFLFAAFTLFMTITTTAHAILKKQDTAAVVAWVGVIWIAPVLGPISYVVLGVNRINRRADHRRHAMWRWSDNQVPGGGGVPVSPSLAPLARVSDRITHRRILSGNGIEALVNGTTAYPAMLEAIEQATQTIALTSYIFNNDKIGREFVTALARAVQRGVTVRVLVDAAGARYSFPRATILGMLARHHIRAARFMPTKLPWRMPYMNLRSHRKVLVVDGVTGFTGGLNISDANNRPSTEAGAVQDVHFRLTGPIVRHLQEVFVEDWAFATDETLGGEAWFPPLAAQGDIQARGIADGPDETFDRLKQILFSAITSARHSVRIVTPYFLPRPSLVRALTIAAMRGVDVDIVLPARGNLRIVQWASMAHLEPLLQWGCRVWLTPRPFDHSKLMVVDGGWSLIGSANWDPRSLSLNFEFNVECYDAQLAARITHTVEQKIAAAQPLQLVDVQTWPLWKKLRNGVARLFSPYL